MCLIENGKRRLNESVFNTEILPHLDLTNFIQTDTGNTALGVDVWEIDA
jgi:hypothetical protein